MSSRIGACDALFNGVHAIDLGLPDDVQVTPGMHWRCQGRAVRLDRGTLALWLGRPLARADQRPRARARAARLTPVPGAALATEIALAEPAPPGGLVLTDGRRLYPARLVEAGGRRTIVFDPWLPAPGTDLWVTACAQPAAPARRGTTGGVVAGCLIETEDGLRPIETLAPGERVMTRDHGFQPVLWRGETRLSGAELILHPHLRPLRLAQDALGDGRPERALRLAPGHRLLVPGLPGLSGRPEALAAAEDLEDGRRIRRELGGVSVVYVHLLLPRHEILRIEGLDCESFHPGLADPVALRWHARGLECAVPGLSAAPQRFGDPARRCLTTAEAALLAYAA